MNPSSQSGFGPFGTRSAPRPRIRENRTVAVNGRILSNGRATEELIEIDALQKIIIIIKMIIITIRKQKETVKTFPFLPLLSLPSDVESGVHHTSIRFDILHFGFDAQKFFAKREMRHTNRIHKAVRERNWKKQENKRNISIDTNT